MRGKHWEKAPYIYEGGLIPACAGKTYQEYGSQSLISAHPRVCGENLAPAVLAFGYAGSSPRVRGKLNEDQ